MQRAARLRSLILTALAGGLVAAPTACGGKTGDDGGSSSGGSGTGGSTATGGQSSGGSAGKPTLTCDFGTKVEQCFSPEAAWNVANNPPQGGDIVGNCPPFGLISNSCCNAAQAGWEDAGQCCYAFCEGACCGRPFTVDGAPRIAGVMERNDWLTRFEPAPGPSRSIADAWLLDARMEHASIASFARFTLELLALGAPAELLADAQRALGDEIEHARLCFGLSTRFGGRELGPATLDLGTPHPEVTLESAVIAAFREGAVGETIAALAARRARDQAEDPAVCAALDRIAADEERHAALAYRFLAFGLRQGGESVRRALEQELSTLGVPASNEDARELDTSQAEFRAAGRLTRNELDETARSAVREVIIPCVRALLESASSSVRPSAADRRGEAVGDPARS
ncbi:MAG: ferritin-like domain-containing protein [Myxococcales bacterium]|nr:ferritin-like domain-containing protein [Myxococcales bacterium]